MAKKYKDISTYEREFTSKKLSTSSPFTSDTSKELDFKLYNNVENE